MKITSKRLDQDGNVVITSRKMKGSDIALSLLGLMLGFIMIFPIFYALTGGLKNDNDFNQVPPILVPKVQNIMLQNYWDELSLYQIAQPQNGNSYHIQPSFDGIKIPRVPRFLFNSSVTACVGTAIRLIIATLAAYSFSFYKFKGHKVLFYLSLISAMIPPEVLLSSNYMTIERLLLIDSYLGMTIVFFVSAISIFLLRQKFMSFPSSLRDAALLDGCGGFMFLLKICVPAAKSVYVILATASFFELWNTYLWPLLVTNKEWINTVSVGLARLSFLESGSAAPLFAALALSMIPLLIVISIFQRKLQSSFDFALQQ